MVHWSFSRIRRRLFTVVSVISLILCVATCLFWIRAQYVYDSIKLTSDRGVIWFTTWRSYAGLDVGVHLRPPTAEDVPQRFRWSSGLPVEGDHRWFVPRFRHTVFPPDPTQFERERWDIRVPYWLMLLVTIALPIASFRRARVLRRRAQDHLCLHCGYDLRATPERCPECGAVAAQIPNHE